MSSELELDFAVSFVDNQLRLASSHSIHLFISSTCYWMSDVIQWHSGELE